MAKRVSGSISNVRDLPDDFDFTIKEARCVVYDFGFDKGGERPCLKIVYETEEYGDVEQYYSIGSKEIWNVLEDGTGFVRVDDSKGPGVIQKQSKLGQFILSLSNAGYDTDLLSDGDFTVLKGLKGHAQRVPSVTVQGTDGDGRTRTMLVISAVYEVPGKHSAAKKIVQKPQAVQKPKEDQAKSTDDQAKTDNDDEISEILLRILSEHGAINKREIVPKVFSLLKDDPDYAGNSVKIASVTKAIMNEAFLKKCTFWSYDGNIISLNT